MFGRHLCSECGHTFGGGIPPWTRSGLEVRTYCLDRGYHMRWYAWLLLILTFLIASETRNELQTLKSRVSHLDAALRSKM